MPVDPRPILTILSLAAGGDGVAVLADGRTVFVPHSAPGDQVELRVTEEHQRYARAEVLRVVKPGPDRISPPCPVAGRCGGCAWQHLDYRAQAKAKQGFLREALRRIGGFEEPPLGDFIPAERPYTYRNKGQLPVANAPDGGLRLGYYREGSHSVVPLPDEGCRLLEPAVNHALMFVRSQLPKAKLQAYDQRNGEGNLRHVMVRANTKGEAMVVLVTKAPMVNHSMQVAAGWVGQAGIVSVQSNIQDKSGNVILGPQTAVLAGPESLVERLDGLAFRLSATSFFQVNPAQTLRLLGALKSIRPWAAGEQVLELYCGVGTLSLPLGKLGLRVHGVESHPAAVEDARANAAANQLAKLSFSVADAATAFNALPAGFTPGVVLMDPPRKGLDKAVVEAIVAGPAQEAVYVSCDPASLARDLKALAAAGFKLEKAVGVDLFPQTGHVESVSWLRRSKA
jgi:23S rRNA (uracil1939-C5)-methyltransferase